VKKTLPELTKEIEAFDELNYGHKTASRSLRRKTAGRCTGGGIDDLRIQDTREYAESSMFGRVRGSARVECVSYTVVNQVVDDSKDTVGVAHQKGNNPCTKCGFEYTVDTG
jgi:hypothetical protein